MVGLEKMPHSRKFLQLVGLRGSTNGQLATVGHSLPSSIHNSRFIVLPLLLPRVQIPKISLPLSPHTCATKHLYHLPFAIPVNVQYLEYVGTSPTEHLLWALWRRPFALAC